MTRMTAELVATLTDRVSAQARQIERSLDRMERTNGRAERGMTRGAVAGGRMSGALKVMALRAGAIAGPMAAAFGAKEVVTTAADFESSLVGIQKKAGTTAEQTAAIGEEIKALATSGEIAVPIEEIAAAYERGAAAGIPIDQLKEFARLSSMAADAFEMSAEDVGNAAAGFQTNLDIPIKDMERYFDLINGLADAGIADESEIVTFLDKVGAKLKSFGLSNEQSAALGASLLNLKMPAEVAARAMDTLTTKLLTPNASKTSRKAFNELYGSTEAFTDLLKEDTQEAMIDFLKKIEKLDKFKRAELLTDILGQGFSGEVGQLSGGIEELLRNLRYAEGRDWFGSLRKSYDLKLDTFWSQWQIMKNALAELAIDTGTMGMPALKGALAGVQTLVAEIGDGMGAFEARLDIKGLSEARQAVGELMSLVLQLLTMGGEGTAIENTFRRLADLINTVSGGIETAQEFMQAIGAIEDTTPDKGVGDAVNKVIDGVAGVSPVGQAAAGVRDVVTGRRTDEERATIEADNDRRRLMMGGGKSIEQLDAERREYWQRRNRRLGDKAVPFAAGEMRLPDITYPTEVPPGLVRHTPVPARRPERRVPIPIRRPAIAAAPQPAPAADAAPQPAPSSDTAAIEAEIRRIDQRLGELSSTAAEVRGAGIAAPGAGAVSSLKSVADEMERLMQRRRELDTLLMQPLAMSAPSIEAPLRAEGDRARLAASEAGNAMLQALSITARPNVDTSAIDALIAKVRSARSELASLGASARAARDSVAGARADYSALHANTTRAG
ncbi:phage tail tape measure protein [Aurantimonas coralicida]|nr:phage tail tape measure protein [Aurantimonas coralicida]